MSIHQGLTASRAAALLRQFGPNELPARDRRNIWRIAFDVVRQPMFALLLGASAIYLILGEPVDAIALGLFATISVSISVVQETRSEHVLESLRELASPRALVIRDGSPQRIAGRDVVPDDILILAEGDRVPADAILIEGADILADESILTGESVPVRKRASPAETGWGPAGGEDRPTIFSGTLIARGAGIARVVATGLRSEMGKIGQALQSINLEQPRLWSQLNWLLRDFGLLAILVAGLAVLLFGLLRGSWLQAVLGGIAIGMSMLPEEIPMVLAVFMAMGAWRISRARVLTRRAAAIETLGSATVLCTDKTGTMTENRMRVEFIAAKGCIWRYGDAVSSSNAIEDILHAALGASAPIPTDPMDRAIHDAAAQIERVLSGTLLQSYGLRPDLFATTNLWGGDGVSASAFAKGAPEAISELCDLNDLDRNKLLAEADVLAAQGMRLLAVAEAEVPLDEGKHPQSQRDIPFKLLGLIGLADPLRANVPGAVKECAEAGVRVIMITGDYPTTARAIAKQAGIASEQIVPGDDMERLDDAALAQTIKTASVFARIRPHQKLRLVEALKRDGEIVAMTGDGVNDAPAMKAAHIGIAMGGRGTDVAREAASLVLLDDDFASIVSTIRLGRRIYDNLRKAVQYIVSVHIPIAGLALLPFCFGLPLILMPVQIALLEMVIDPACSIVFESEAEERDVMKRPPRKPGSSILPPATALWAALQGLAALALVGAALVIGARVGMPENDLRAFVFTALVLMNIGLILVNRSFHASLRRALLKPNPALWLLVSSVFLVLGIGLYWGPAQRLFHFGALHFDDLGVCAAAGIGLIGVLEFSKKFLPAASDRHPL